MTFSICCWQRFILGDMKSFKKWKQQLKKKKEIEDHRTYIEWKKMFFFLLLLCLQIEMCRRAITNSLPPVFVLHIIKQKRKVNKNLK